MVMLIILRYYSTRIICIEISETDTERELTEAFNLLIGRHNIWRQKTAKIKTISFCHGECCSLVVLQKKVKISFMTLQPVEMKASLIIPVGLRANSLVYILTKTKRKKNLISVLISKSKVRYRRNQGRNQIWHTICYCQI